MDKKKFVIIDNPKKLSAERFSEFSKHCLIKVTEGYTLEDFQTKFQSLIRCFEDNNKEDFYKEINNTFSVFWNLQESINLDARALVPLVDHDNEEEVYTWLTTAFTHEELEQKTKDIKKNFIQN